MSVPLSSPLLPARLHSLRQYRNSLSQYRTSRRRAVSGPDIAICRYRASRSGIQYVSTGHHVAYRRSRIQAVVPAAASRSSRSSGSSIRPVTTRHGVYADRSISPKSNTRNRNFSTNCTRNAVSCMRFPVYLSTDTAHGPPAAYARSVPHSTRVGY
eukprot:331150-Rhodomonas_salina.1